MAKPARGKELLPDDPKHGRYATYCYYKCRCGLCSLAMREYWQMKRYGLTGTQIKERVEAQGGCGSCGKPNPSSLKGWAVDHNHETGALRGILCPNCNSALGLLGDNAEGVEKLLAYIRSWN